MDFIQILTSQTGTVWSEIDGPDSGVGVDHYFADDKGNEAYANVDQGYYTLSVNDETFATGEM